MSTFPANIRCTFCGSTGMDGSTIPAGYPRSLPIEDEINIIQHEIQRVEQALAKLSQDRAVLQRRLNARRSAIYQLPPEILCHTFQFLIPGEQNMSFGTANRPIYLPAYPRLLGEVSFSWRQIVVTTPRFWSTLIYRVIVDEETPFAEALRLYLRYSEILPFHLELEVKRTSEYDLYGLDLRPIEGVIFDPQYAARFKSLHLVNAPQAWGERIGTRGLFKSLTQLMWSTEEIEESGLAAARSLEYVTSLRHLIFSGTPISVNLPASITILRLHAVCPRTSMEILKQCRQLVEVYYTSSRCFSWHCDPYTLPSYDNSTIISLPILRKLVVFDVRSQSWPTLNRLQLPAIETVEIHFAEETSGSTAAHSSSSLPFKFFAQLPQSIRKLTLVNCTFPMEVVQMILQPLSGLQMLSFNGINRDVENMIHVLTPSASHKTHEHTFPALREPKLSAQRHQEDSRGNEHDEDEDDHRIDRNNNAIADDRSDGDIIGSADHTAGTASDINVEDESGNHDDATLNSMEHIQ